jgi:hypothetical protein
VSELNVVMGAALVTSVICSLTYFSGCGAATTVAPVLDLTALELACVNAATTPQSSIDCRNAVRSAWAKANNLTVANLEGGPNAVDH